MCTDKNYFFFCCPGAYGFADWLPFTFLACPGGNGLLAVAGLAALAGGPDLTTVQEETAIASTEKTVNARSRVEVIEIWVNVYNSV